MVYAIARHAFQTPLLRVNHCYSGSCVSSSSQLSRFRPLYCGSTIATPTLTQMSVMTTAFQTPLLRVNHCYAASLPDREAGKGFRPLYCGSTIATVEDARSRVLYHSFRPLYCGSTIATWIALRFRDRCMVSDPFTAGQPLLPMKDGEPVFEGGVSDPFTAGQPLLPVISVARYRSLRCFRPLYCGSTIATGPGWPDLSPAAQFQTPLLRVNHCYVAWMRT